MEETKARFSKRFHHTRLDAIRQYIRQILPSFLLGLLCSLAALPFGLVPFGVAAAATRSNSRLASISLYAGAVAGYLAGGLKHFLYIGGVLLTLPLKAILSRLLPRRRSDLAAVLSAAGALLAVYAVAAAQYHFLIFDIVTGVCGVLLGAVFTYFAGQAKEIFLRKEIRQTGLTQGESVGVMLLVSVLLLPLTGLAVYDVSPARAAAVFFVLLMAYYGKAAQGAMCGVITGVILSLGRADFSHVIAAYAFSGLIAGLFSGSRRVRAAIAFMLANAVITLYLNNSIITLISLSEVMIAGSLFCILPARWIEKAASFLLISLPRSRSFESARFKELVLGRLRTASDSLGSVSSALGGKTAPVQTADVQTQVANVAETVCRNCRLSSYCWSAAYNDTAGIFNSAAKCIEDKGGIQTADLPEYFTARCIHREEILNEFNLAANALALASHKEETVAENRRIMAAQYEAFGSYVTGICDEITKLSRFDENLGRRVRQFFLNLGASSCEAMAYYDRYDALYLEADAVLPQSVSDKKVLAGLSELCGYELVCKSSEYRDGVYSYRFCQRENLALQVTAAQRNKSGENVCGDSFSAFKSVRYQKVLALSDGMGSGAEAGRVSQLTLEVLQHLLESGFGPENACSLVNTTLLLGCGGQSFSTLDLASVNLFNGKADFYKMGAAPTLILRDGKAYEVFCKSLPAGVMEEPHAEHRSCRLREGDIVLMLSDGVEITHEILKYCQQAKGKNLSELCEEILRLADADGKAADDMTVAAALVCRKKGA